MTGCGDTPPPRSLPLLPDTSPLESCPAAYPAPPQLVPLAPFALADGRKVVLLDTVIARDGAMARYLIEGRDAWFECRSPVLYVQDWVARMAAQGRK